MCATKCHGGNLTKWKISNESADEKKQQKMKWEKCVFMNRDPNI